MSSLHCRREGLPAPGDTGGGLCQLGGREYCSVGDRDPPSRVPHVGSLLSLLTGMSL